MVVTADVMGFSNKFYSTFSISHLYVRVCVLIFASVQTKWHVCVCVCPRLFARASAENACAVIQEEE